MIGNVVFLLLGKVVDVVVDRVVSGLDKNYKELFAEMEDIYHEIASLEAIVGKLPCNQANKDNPVCVMQRNADDGEKKENADDGVGLCGVLDFLNKNDVLLHIDC